MNVTMSVVIGLLNNGSGHTRQMGNRQRMGDRQRIGNMVVEKEEWCVTVFKGTTHFIIWSGCRTDMAATLTPDLAVLWLWASLGLLSAQ
jgi:hypothetical protein